MPSFYLYIHYISIFLLAWSSVWMQKMLAGQKLDLTSRKKSYFGIKNNIRKHAKAPQYRKSS